MEKINSEYYDPYVGYPDIRIIKESNGDKFTFEIWEGLFFTLCTNLWEGGVRDGIVEQWAHTTGMYEEDRWYVPDANYMLKQFEMFDNDRIDEKSTFKNKIPIMVDAIKDFFLPIKETDVVYVEYD